MPDIAPLSLVPRPAVTRVLVVVGTRPEAIKVAPVVLALRDTPDMEPVVVLTGQHPDMADEALATFGVRADHRLALPGRRSGSQADLMAHLLPALDTVVGDVDPGAVLVQGDTASAFAGALAGFWRRVPVVHVEAGLRTESLAEPFPEEGYRRLISRVAHTHLAPTPQAVADLLAEGIDAATVMCTGNTVVDAARLSPRHDPVHAVPGLRRAGEGRVALLTVHRRESWGEPLRRILGGVRDLLDEVPDLQVVVPVHPNPLVRDVVSGELGAHPQVLLVAPLTHPELMGVLERADVVLTDSGGIQEEAPTFGTPVIVLRDTTERTEAVTAGTAWLVGTDPVLLRNRAREVLARRPDEVAPPNPFGDGRAAGRVACALRTVFAGAALPASWDPSHGCGPTGERRRPPAATSAAPTPCPQPDEAPGWVRRMERVGAEVRPGAPVATRPVLSPPTPTTQRHEAGRLGLVDEVRRGRQVLRHLPGLPPALLPHGADDPWIWPARQQEGVLWIECDGTPIVVHVPGGRVEVRHGAAISRWDPAEDTTTVTVISGRALVAADRGDSLAIGPRQATTIHPIGTLDGRRRVAPADLDADAWVGANRRLSHATRPEADELVAVSPR